MIARGVVCFIVGISVAIGSLAITGDASAEQTCVGAFGPGHTAHPDFPNVCCWPGAVPVAGEPRCVYPGQQDGRPAPPWAGGGAQPPVSDAPGGHCIPHGGTCTLGGAPCCDHADTCQGAFPNTYCR